MLTAALARTGTNFLSPPLDVPLPPGAWTECVASNITGYENEKNSHLAVSYAIYSGNSNVGLGIMSAAKSYNLDFIPLKEENFDIVIPKNILNEKYVELMLNIINSLEFKKAINNIGGYITKNTGNQIKL